jgi:dephospho-CoA kinase
VPVLGVTGGIATGKSTFVRALIRQIPAEVFDADRAAHELLADDEPTHGAIREVFGAGVLDADGKPDRARLREIVFSDELQRKRLEDILHPAIRSRWVALAENTVRTGGWLCVDIPLLYETGVEANFDRTIVVACSPGTQRRRLQDLRGLDAGMADRMIAAQLDLNLKITKADHLIWNDSTDTCLEGQVSLLAGWLLKFYGRN